MIIDDKKVEKLANLSNLHLPPEKKESLKNDLTTIIGWVKKLQKVDTKGVEPLSVMSHEVNQLRNDEPTNPLPHESALKNAPARDSNYFHVPHN